MLNKILPALALFATLNAGCFAATDPAPADVTADAQEHGQGEALFDTTGTALIVSGQANVSCVDGGGKVTLSGYVVTTGAKDAVTITLSGALSNTLSIPANGWQAQLQRYKGSFLTGTVDFSDGEYSVTACAAQRGSNGRDAKSACTTMPFTVSCSDS